jgi:translation initiation factor 3 subunit C
LLANAQFYLSLSSQQLCELYDLPPRRVHAIVSKMIAEEALPASHDQPTGTIVIHHQELTRLQMLSSQFADKAAILVDLNERALAMRTGVLHTEDEDESGGGGGGRRGGDGSAPGGRRTRMGSRVASSFSGPSGGGGYGYASGGRGGRGGRGRGRGTSAGGFMADIGFTGGVYGRGRTVRQRDDSNYMSLGRVGGGYGRAP